MLWFSPSERVSCWGEGQVIRLLCGQQEAPPPPCWGLLRAGISTNTSSLNPKVVRVTSLGNNHGRRWCQITKIKSLGAVMIVTLAHFLWATNSLICRFAEPVSTAEGVPERARSHLMVEGGAEGAIFIIMEGATESLNVWIMLTLMTTMAIKFGRYQHP